MQLDKCLSQPLLTVIAVDRESDVFSSGNQRRRKWLVCPELEEPLCGRFGRTLGLEITNECERTVDRSTRSVLQHIVTFPEHMYCPTPVSTFCQSLTSCISKRSSALARPPTSFRLIISVTSRELLRARAQLKFFLPHFIRRSLGVNSLQWT